MGPSLLAGQHTLSSFSFMVFDGQLSTLASIDAGEGFEFVFQVSSDSKINLNVIDCGSFQFYRNPKTNAWKIYCDFY